MPFRNPASLTILVLVTPWADRSPVLAAMLNPALLAAIIAAAAAEYERGRR